MALNASGCWEAVEFLQLGSARFVFVLLFLTLVDLVIVLGNSLVITAVLVHPRMHTTTNWLITSLAVSDLLIGVVVLPFSISNQLLHEHWLYGRVWCQMWLAIDVWLCTASIYNLVAISFDRFMALARPIKYKFVASRRMGRMLVSKAWCISFLICLPPLVIPFAQKLSAQKDVNATTPDELSCACTPMNNSSGYVIYSALGSFFVPLVLIIVLNMGIYRKARSAAITMRTGYKSVKTTANNTPSAHTAAPPDEPVLRVHRGGTSVSVDKSTNLLRATLASQIEVSLGSAVQQGAERRRSYARTPNSSFENSYRRRSVSAQIRLNALSTAKRNFSITSSTGMLLSQEQMIGNRLAEQHEFMTSTTPSSSGSYRQLFPGSTPLLADYRRRMREAKESRKSNEWMNRRKVYQAETKVAKTVGVVVGCFIICWLPFFVIYTLQAYDICTISGCLPEALFSFTFWMGYGNSALNPLIYALFSRDFRAAFKRILHLHKFSNFTLQFSDRRLRTLYERELS